MSNDNHLYIPHVHRRDCPPSPSPGSREFEEGLDNVFNFMDNNESHPVSLLSIDQNNGLRLDVANPAAAAAAAAQQQQLPPQPTMPTVEEQLAEFRRIAEQQQAQLQRYEQQQEAQMAAFQQLQQSVAQLSQA